MSNMISLILLLPSFIYTKKLGNNTNLKYTWSTKAVSNFLQESDTILTHTSACSISINSELKIEEDTISDVKIPIYKRSRIKEITIWDESGSTKEVFIKEVKKAYFILNTDAFEKGKYIVNIITNKGAFNFLILK